jgi:hypothetical protein
LLDIRRAYSELEKEIPIKIDETGRLKELVNFKVNELTPVHRWYYFKEGYSHQLVEKLLSEFKIKKGSTVLDPFAGSGTTLLACQWKGIHPKGIDINPFFTFVQRAKLDWYKYDLEELKIEIKKLSETKVEEPSINTPGLSSFKRVYLPEILKQLLFFKEAVLKLEDELTKNFLLLGLASILEEVSLIKKDGKGLKFIKGKKVPDVKGVFLSKLNSMFADLHHMKSSFFASTEKVEGEVFTADTRKAIDFIDKGSIDFIMFSPPYLNTFDYTEVYKLELWFLDFVKDYDEFKALRASTLRSHNLFNWEPTKIWEHELLERIVEEIKTKKLWSDIIPVMIQGYFDDMFLSMQQLHKVLKQNAYCLIVVGNSSYANIPIPTDLLLAKVGEDAGFEPIEVRVARQLLTSSQQLKRLGEDLRVVLRESIIVLRNT